VLLLHLEGDVLWEGERLELLHLEIVRLAEGERLKLGLMEAVSVALKQREAEGEPVPNAEGEALEQYEPLPLESPVAEEDWELAADLVPPLRVEGEEVEEKVRVLLALSDPEEDLEGERLTEGERLKLGEGEGLPDPLRQREDEGVPEPPLRDGEGVWLGVLLLDGQSELDWDLVRERLKEGDWDTVGDAVPPAREREGRGGDAELLIEGEEEGVRALTEGGLEIDGLAEIEAEAQPEFELVGLEEPEMGMVPEGVGEADGV
jgi:hypothetical protein